MMLPLSSSWTACLSTVLALAFGGGALGQDTTFAGHLDVSIYSHVFNAMNGALQKWDSSLNPNGMSFFLVTVPEGTLLYHGNPRPEPVKGTEFLAFDPEFSLIFARKCPGRRENSANYGGRQRVLPVDPSPLAGWLHTYKTVKDLNLVYVDGRAAAKSQSGTLDSFDRILMNDSVSGGFEGEYKRAETFCKFSQERWDRRVDGVIRLGGDFEIILCSFQENLERVRIVRVRAESSHHPIEYDVPARAQGIGIRQATVNFDRFVSAYTYGLNLFNYTDDGDGDHGWPGPPGHGPQGLDSSGYMSGNFDHVRQPRLKHIPSGALQPIRHDVEELIRSHSANQTRHDWRAVVDMTVRRYVSEIEIMASGAVETRELLYARMLRLLTPFIDYDSRDNDTEVERCATEFLPGTANTDSLAYRTVYSVTRHICSTLQEALHDEEVDLIVNRIKQLKNGLQWAV